MKIVIADDHQLILEGFSKVLYKAMSDIEIRTAIDLIELQSVLEDNRIDILFQDIRFGKDDAREFLGPIMEQHPEMHVIIITSSGDDTAIGCLFKMGVSGYLLKSDEKGEITRAIETVLNGEKYISPEIMEIRKGNKIDYEQTKILTPRELEILQFIINGRTTKEIAESIHLSDKTVESHRMNLFLKFDVKNVAGLVRKAILEGFL